MGISSGLMVQRLIDAKPAILANSIMFAEHAAHFFFFKTSAFYLEI